MIVIEPDEECAIMSRRVLTLSHWNHEMDTEWRAEKLET
jgi:hypothetical protein